MTIPDLLRRAADELEELDRLVASEFGDGSPDEDITRDATALRTLADRLEKPTEEMIAAQREQTLYYQNAESCIIATIAAAGEGL